MNPPTRRQFGWAMYDWANSAYVTTVAVAVLPAWFAAVVVPKSGWEFGGTMFSATSLWGYATSLASFLVFAGAPILGTISDLAASKRLFLSIACAIGSLASVLLLFCGPGDVGTVLTLYILAQIAFVGGNIFYDALLPRVAGPLELDRVSGLGFGLGYIGGGLQFALALGLITLHQSLGIGEGLAARIGMATAGLWWAGFAALSLRMIGPESTRAASAKRPSFRECLGLSLSRLAGTVRRIRSLRPVLIFLLAYMVYNDGIQTVIGMATIFGKEELGLPTSVLMLTLLLIQFTAAPCSWLFSRLAERITARRAIILSLVIWCAIAGYGYFITSATQFLILGGAVGLVLGGSQALSRSLYASMVPPEESGEFFGFYAVFTKLSAIWGPLLFAAIRQATGSSRPAILALVVFFALGIGLLILLGSLRKTEPAVD